MGLDFLCCKTKSKVITITDDSNNISTSVSGRFVQNEVKRKTKIAIYSIVIINSPKSSDFFFLGIDKDSMRKRVRIEFRNSSKIPNNN